MLFPYAKCNLREYMGQENFNALNRQDIIWLLSQLVGLASAVKHIHDLSAGSTGTVPGLQALDEKCMRAGWHHDLKPENILFFSASTSADKKAILRIADFGSSKIQTYRSGSINTRSPNGTPTYEPPEFIKDGTTSRPYDIWSLGAVFLELLVWAFIDNDAVQRFREQRHDRQCPGSNTNTTLDDAFWQMATNGDVYLREAVVDCMKHLRTVLERGKQRHFIEVLRLIERMLEPQREKRIIALDLHDTLERIHRQTSLDFDLNPTKGRSTSNASSRSSIRLSVNPPDRRSPESSLSRRRSASLNAGYADCLTASPINRSHSPGTHS